MYLLMKLTLRKDFSFYRCIGLRKQLSTIKDNLAGGYDIHPAWTSDDNHLLMVYYAGGLLQDKEKRYSTGLLPERKKELDELLKNIKEDDNPVVILVTLKPKKDNKQ